MFLGPRPQVAIQWGQPKKATESNQTEKKKAVPVIGKMPGLNRSKKTPDKDRARSLSLEPEQERPPPSTHYTQQHYATYGLTPEMYMQVITCVVM